MTGGTRPIKLYKSKEFKDEVRNFMSEGEEEAFCQHLIRNPLRGEPMPEAPGCLVIEWVNGRAFIRYIVSDDHESIFLISISSERRLKFPPEDKDIIYEILSALKKFGIGAALREMYDAMKDWLGP